MLPRIPQVPSLGQFQAFVEAGKELSDLHIGYESLEPYALNEVATGLTVEQDECERSSTAPRSPWRESPKTPTATCLDPAQRSTGFSSGTRSRLTRPQVSSTTRTTDRASMSNATTSST